jgi:predicted small lipoprotein YifL
MMRLALVAALVAAAGLAACGRKGPLEPPPSAKVTEPADGKHERAPPVMSADGRPIAPPGKKRRIFLDWLID